MDWFENFVKDMTNNKIRQLQYCESHSSDENLVIFCKSCGSLETVDIVKDRIDLTISEKEIRCKDCGELLNYWSYGHYDNYDFMDEKYFKMLRQKKLERILK